MEGVKNRSTRIEGYAIISEDGMIADGDGNMPPSLKLEADQIFFEQGLDAVDIVVHGRNSHEQQKRSHLRRRVIVTRKIPDISPDSTDKNILFWNPAGASFEQALDFYGPPNRLIGVVGGTDVFGLFLPIYDVFYLSTALGVRIPDGRPVFPDVPAKTPEDVLAENGLVHDQRLVLDKSNGLLIERWCRALS